MFKKLLTGFVVILVLCGIAAWLMLPQILVPEAQKRLMAMGFDSVELSDAGFSLHGLTLRHVKLIDNGQEIIAKNMALRWNGFDPRDMDNLYIEDLTLPLNFNSGAPPLSLSLNLQNNASSPSSFTIPDVHIDSLNLITTYKDDTFHLIARDAEVQKQGDKYNFSADIPLDQNDLKKYGTATGDISLAGTFENAGAYSAEVSLENITYKKDGETPAIVEALSGDILIAKTQTAPEPEVRANLYSEEITIDGAVFRKVEALLKQNSDGDYIVTANTDSNAATTLALNAIANIKTRRAKGLFKVNSTDLSGAPQDYPQLADPVLSGALSANFDFDIQMPQDAPYNDIKRWSGKFSGPVTLSDVRYNDIKGINSKINLAYSLSDQILNTDFDFKSATPKLDAAADLKFDNIDEENKTVITGNIRNVVFDVFTIKSTNAYATYDRAAKSIIYDLKGATIIPRGTFSKYPNLNGRLRGTFKTPMLGFNFNGIENGGRFDIQANGQYNTENKSLDITYKLLPKKSLDADDITKFFPALKSSLREFQGVIAIDGGGKLRNGRFTSRQDIKIDAQSITINTIEAVGIAGVIELATTPAIVVDKEEVFVGGLDVGGLPLKEGEIIFSFNSAQNKLDIHDMKWKLADGLLTTPPFTFNTKTRSADVVLKAERIDLKPLFSYMPMEGLTASGHVSGEIPVSINQGKLSVKQGHLEAVDTGDLQYNPEETPEFLKKDNPYINMVRDALKDYNYNILSLTVDGSSGERQQVILKASGSNPDFFDGRPVNLNLNIEGELEDLLKFNVGAFNLPERIKNKMKAFEE